LTVVLLLNLLFVLILPIPLLGLLLILRVLFIDASLSFSILNASFFLLLFAASSSSR